MRYTNKDFIFLLQMEEIKIEITEDGSHTLYVPTLCEHYHSTHGALQESKHVYIEAG
jgi:transposase